MIHFVIPDPHAHPDHDNLRAEAIGELMFKVNPDVVICLGDSADLGSLRSGEKGTKSFEGKRYQKDIEAHLDFQERLWYPYRKYRKARPKERVFLIGNHEQRINTFVDKNPEMAGFVSLKDLDLEYNYNIVVPYDGNVPGMITLSGITYAHYVVSGVMGKPIGGVHQAYNLLSKHHSSVTVGHSHTLDFSVQTKANGHKIMGLSAGVGIDYDTDWAGHSGKLWWRGIVIKDNVTQGMYDPTFVSMNATMKNYI